MDKTLKIALVGAGMFGGDVHLRAYCQIEQNGLLPWLGRLGLDPMARKLGDIAIEFVALGTRTQATCAQRKEEFSKRGMNFVTYYGETPWLDILRDFPDLDILAVATPDHLHTPPILAALTAGVHVITEKPLALDANEADAVLAASRKANVIDRVAAAQAAGLKVAVVDAEPYAAEMAFTQICAQLPEGAEDKCVALIDIGASVMNVNVMRNGQSIYTRDQQIGGEQLTLSIQSQFGLSAEQAEFAKRNGNLPDNYESDVLSPFRDNLVMEIARALQFFFTSSQYNEVDYIVLAGGSAVLPGLDDAVATRTQVSTMEANPFALMTLSSRVKPRQLQADAPALIVACGLAMRRFDPS